MVRIGLLPQWFFISGERIPRDVSALGIEAPAAEHETYTGWSALNTDGMVSGTTMRPARLPMSLPVGIGSPNRFSDFTTDYCAGFRSQLEVIAEDRGSWLGDDGQLEQFRDLRSRFIRRPTWIYLWVRGKLLSRLRCETKPPNVRPCHAWISRSGLILTFTMTQFSPPNGHN